MTDWPTISLERPMRTLLRDGVVVLGTDGEGRSRQLLLEVRSIRDGAATVWWSLLPPDRFTTAKRELATCEPDQSLVGWVRATTEVVPTSASLGAPISWGYHDRGPLLDWRRLGGGVLDLLGAAARSSNSWTLTVLLLLLVAILAWEDPGSVRELLVSLWWVPVVVAVLVPCVLVVSWLARSAQGIGVRGEHRLLRAEEIAARIDPVAPVISARPLEACAGPAPWSVVAPDAPLTFLAGGTVLVWLSGPDAGAPTVVGIARDHRGRAEEGSVWVTWASLGSTARPRTKRLSATSRLNDFCRRYLRSGVTHVLVVPEPAWAARWSRRSVTWLPRPDDPSVGYPEHELTSRVTAFARADEPHPVRSAPSAAMARVDGVKEEYGELSSDIVYRIENSALFDDTVALTRQFTLLLMRWEDELPHAEASALERLAMEVRLAFDTARQHAEAVGVSHLPRTARAKAERAVKAAQLALHAATDGEREAASEQLARILDGIALHYLPGSRDVRRMISEARPQLRPTP